MESLLDAYTLRARVYPGLLVLAPVLITGTAVFRGALTGLSAILSVLIATGMLYLLSHLVREAGKSKEHRLWQRWGGKPSTVRLRWRTAEIDDHRNLIRSRLARVALDVPLPTHEEERADPAAADRRYDAAVAALREATRDKERFPVVFSENVSYGFRRNTWAVRPLGLLTTAAAAAVGSYCLAARPPSDSLEANMLWAASGANGLLLAFWLFNVSGRWVRKAADAYTDALFSAASVLAAGP